MGALGGSRRHRRLGRSRLYELIIAPLSHRERLWLVGGLIGLGLILIVPRVTAGNSDVGSIIQVPFSNCSADGSWSQADQAASPAGQSAALWQSGADPLECSGLSVDDPDIARPVLAFDVFAMAAAVTESPAPATVSPLDADAKGQRRDDYPSYLIDSPRTKADIDSLLLVQISTDGGSKWQDYSYVPQAGLDQAQIGLVLPPMTSTELTDLSVRVVVTAQTDDARLGLNSLSIFYTIAQPTDLEFKLSAAAEAAGGGRQPIFSAASPTQATLKMRGPGDNLIDGLGSAGQRLIGAQPSEPDINFTAKLSRDGQTHSLASQLDWTGTELDGSGQWDVRLTPPRQLEPGSYELITTVGTSQETAVTTKQDVWYGVVAINTAQSSYAPNESIEFLLSVLDETGATVCDADINLKISKADQTITTLSTAGGTIEVTDTCQLYGNHNDPDYSALAQLSEPGRYDLTLEVKTDDQSYVLVDAVDVGSDPPFLIKRSAPTRIYPVNAYDMVVTITAQQDFNGLVTEDIPASFKLLPLVPAREYTTIALDSQTTQLQWPVDIKSGESLEFKYRFDAPDVSPAFYQLGPLRLSQGDQEVFAEQRRWQLAGDAIGHMLAFYDGASAPNGWTCVSCSPGDDFYQRFPRGSAAYGGSGGAATHSHSASISIAATGSAAVSISQSGTALSDNSHSHSGNASVVDGSNLPSFRQLKIIRADTAGEPATLPAGLIGLFDDTPPSGWSQYSAHDGYYVRGESTAGTTGGSNSHNHALTMTINSAAGTTHGVRSPASVAAANAGHTHTANGNSTIVNQEPPYLVVILGQLASDAAPPDNLIAMWDEQAPANWTGQSDVSGTFHERFLKAGTSFGATGGNTSHNHTDVGFTSSAPSATTLSRSGTDVASGNHSHTVTVSAFSTTDNLPPYRDVLVAKRVAQSDINLSGYRYFTNTDSADVGPALAADNTPVSSPRQNTPFRLRFLLHISNADLDPGNRFFKLQYAERSGTCDTSFVGETYGDIQPDSGAIRFYNNSSISDGVNLTGNAGDPGHSGHTRVNQTYEEANNFTNSTASIPVGQDGLWDAALVDNSAVASTSYCFRVVRSNGDLLESYSFVPEIVTDDGNGHMLLLYDDAVVPSGWSCVSCNPGDDFYQRFIRGSAAYGASGGSASHDHTASAAIAATTGLTGDSVAGSGVASGGHSHTVTPVINGGDNLPPYRQLKVIRADTSGVPANLPAGIIALFDANVPSGWTRYSAQDGNYIRGENTVGSTGGGLTHDHIVSGTTSTGSGSNDAPTNGSQTSLAADSHNHMLTGNTASANHEPAYREVILGQLDADSAAPQNIITMWDGPYSASWTDVSSVGQPFYQRFLKPAVSYGSGGGVDSHSHTNSTISTSAPSATVSRRIGSASASSTHIHDVNLSAVSTSSNLPPYMEVLVAKLGSLNTAPDAPTNLEQTRPSDSSTIAIGGWANSGQVRFVADATDTDNPDNLQLCIEVELVGTAFDNVDTGCGSAVSYSGTVVAVNLNLSGLSNGDSYHWQARIKDGAGGVSSWSSFGANAESATDFSADSIDPDGAVFDGQTPGVDLDFNNGALDSLSANWDITDNESGLANFDYAIGTTPQGTDIVNWTDVDASTSISVGALSLRTTVLYYVSVRASDAAGNQAVIVSDGLYVAPTLSFSTSPAVITFETLNAGNSYSNNQSATLTTSTNAYGGYLIWAYIEQLPTSDAGGTIGLFDGGSYAAPSAWEEADSGYGYTSNDNDIAGSNIFNGSPCLGGGNSPCWAPFSTMPPGDIVADHTAPIQGTAVTDENFILTQRVSVDSTQPAGAYTTTIIYTVMARY